MIDLSLLLPRILKPALGCTEPVAVALATAAAASAAAGRLPADPGPCPPPGTVLSVRVAVNKNVFKNAFSVHLPKAGGHKGIAMAAALGPFCDPARELSLLADLDPARIAAAEDLVRRGRVAVDIAPEAPTSLYIEAEVRLAAPGAPGTGTCVIRGHHSNIVRISAGGRTLLARDDGPAAGDASDDGLAELRAASVSDLVAAVEELAADVRALVLRTVDMNLKAAEAGLANPLGLGTGFFGNPPPWSGGGLAEHITSMTAAGSDARMSGFPVEVMSSAGSGNQGIVATVPIVVFSRHRGVPEERMLRAVALAHLVTMYATQFVGYLSALCGVAVKAGLGAACGVVYAMGGGAEEVGRVVKIIAASLTGMICDGAKAGCALKVSSAADMAVRAAALAMKKAEVPDDNGIVAATPEETIRNLARLSLSMESVDREILAIMKEKIPGAARGGPAPGTRGE